MVYSIQYIRAAAICLVVMTHSARLVEPAQNIYFWPNFTEVNIAFTFAAGFLFHRLSIDEPFASFARRRVKNVLLPYLFVSIPAIAMYTILNKPHPFVDLSEMSPAVKTVYLLLTGLHLGPLWFIPMILVIYSVTPLLKLLERGRHSYFIAVILTFALAVAIFKRPADNENPIIAAAHFLPVFIFGMLCSKEEPIFREASVYLWAPCLATLVGVFLFSATQPDDHQFIMKFMMLICGFVIATRFDDSRSKIVDILAAYSFGIFFIHGYLVSFSKAALDRAGLIVAGNHLTLIAVTLTMISLSIAMLFVAKIIFGRRSRLIFGA